jgi:hypothetical protein
LGFGFYFLKNPVFGWVLGFFFQNLKKMENSRQNCEKRKKNLRKSLFKLIAKHSAAVVGKILVPPVPPKTSQNLWLMVNPYSTKSFGY